MRIPKIQSFWQGGTARNLEKRININSDIYCCTNYGRSVLTENIASYSFVLKSLQYFNFSTYKTKLFAKKMKNSFLRKIFAFALWPSPP